MAEWIPEGRLEDVDGFLSRVISLEAARQERKLIMIASESICPDAVLEALATVFNNIYAEGYPPMRLVASERQWIEDVDYAVVNYRRYASRRYYKGVEYADIIESIAQRRLSELFATEEYPPDSIYANVQPLSGAAANNAVYNAFLNPGDTVMGMNLTFGGHLTHGSEANRSGRFYRIVSYEADRVTGRLDYEKMKRLAVETRPKLLIAGFSAYPWAPDWKKFREVADSCGAILLADIAHTAGLVVGGVHPNPIGYADVITFTTHKSLCGARGACILTTNPEYAEAIDIAVFPGEQGGPHIHQVAAKAVCFKLAQKEEFKDLMRRVVENAEALAEAFESYGIPLAYGGTDTHLVMVDLRKIKTPNGAELTGEIASRILDMAHITVNKNTVGGDEDAAHPGAVRFGTVWASQRGMGTKEMKRIAELSAKLLTNIEPFFYEDVKGRVGRGKIDFRLVEEVRAEVEKLLADFPVGGKKESVGYPHLFGIGTARIPAALGETELRRNASIERGVLMHYGDADGEIKAALSESDGVFLDCCSHFCVFVRGRRADGLLDTALSCDVRSMSHYDCKWGYLMDTNGGVLDEVLVVRLGENEKGEDEFVVCGGYADAEFLKQYLRALSDGYIYADDDIYKKPEGPALIFDVGELDPPLAPFKLIGKDISAGLSAISADFKRLKGSQARWAVVNGEKVLVAYADYAKDYDMALLLVPFAVAEFVQDILLVKGLKPVGVTALLALNEKLGVPRFDPHSPTDAKQLYRDGYTDRFDLDKFFFIGQKSLIEFIPKEPAKVEFDYKEDEGKPLKRTALYEEHKRLTRHLVPFAGWEMPVWYSRVTEEHKAVRTTVGIFDVSHMGLLEFVGKDATRFLDIVLSNYVPFFYDGQAFYSYMLDSNGDVIDDTFTYRLNKNRYWMVVNAANTEKDIEWLKGVLEGRYIVDRERPSLSFSGEVTMRNLKADETGSGRYVNVAVQGPKSLALLRLLADDGRERAKLSSLRRSEFVWTHLSGVEIMVARTGYTGERIAFEIYIPWDEAPRIWRELLDAGAKFGAKPCGLGARDSTRTEAGLPLYGHELAGPLNITPIEAGYAAFVKFHKPFFVGRKPLLERTLKRRREVVRFRVMRKGARTVRTGDVVVAARRSVKVGEVTSAALLPDGHQAGMALVELSYAKEGTELAIFPTPHKKVEPKPLTELRIGEPTSVPERAVVIERFPESDTEESE